ncbi:hypothetical protein AOT83_10865 [Mycobacteroides sp. H001]|uniref:ATP-dependent nuclease n=1 Tax=Mycobacteroides TaxID=670516 RepID=UPI000713E939|nr:MULTISPECIES: AAA family ATPase [Mycobacteroides]KRQ29934.1 hypothetical protein AOT86_04365 [Mycobacteroides sp. H072]KRQ41378.1 hypothetical protein AOT84_02115 [Mycobacteroides sp. H002]KRQ46004.1 hypothetical protein AOT85_24285 [Mycobacteroides sp. H054]KRQ70320.1 hypothetical protein AOT83_10865 [Mycobacteroides sp. H001]OHU33301.1 hypothetical protein BKG79_22080 [Mycobacteroides chelonae]
MSNPPDDCAQPENSAFAIHSITIADEVHTLSGSGSVLAVVGANNVGKSTLIDQILTNLRSVPAPGSKPQILSSLDAKWPSTPAAIEEWLRAHCRVHHDIGQTHLSRKGLGSRLDEALKHLTEQDKLEHLTEWLVDSIPPTNRDMYVQPVTRPKSISDPPTHPFHVVLVNKEVRNSVITLARKMFGIDLYLDAVSGELSFRIGDPDVAVPVANDLNPEYAQAVGSLRSLHEQGAGFRSALGLLLPMVTIPSPITLIDEPEAYLHPPQARLMGAEIGRVAALNKSQVILATHDKNILQGVIESETPVDILHLTRDGDVTSARLLRADEVAELWKDPMLRYGNALDGLFHSAVIVTEADRDSRFYEAAIDALYESRDADSPAHNLMFLAANGKQNIAKIVRRLKGFGIRTISCPDLDILNNKAVLSSLVNAHDGEWSVVESHYYKATGQFTAAPPAPDVNSIKGKIIALLDDASGPLSDELAKRIKKEVALPKSTWDKLKKHGMTAFSTGKASAKELIKTLDELGIVAVTLGELERFLTDVDVSKSDPAWLSIAFDAGAHTSTAANEHAERLLKAASIG